MTVGLRRIGMIAQAALLVGCGAAVPAPVGPSPAPAPACVVADGIARGTLTMAIAAPVRVANAPVATNAAERLIFRQLYETLVRIDCEGRAVAGLAEAWSADATGRVWEFELRADARFHDGARVTAHDVVAGWSVSAAASSLLAHVGAAAERVVRVELRERTTDVSAFADDRLTVVRTGARGTAPPGTGRYRMDAAGAGGVRLVRNENAPEWASASGITRAQLPDAIEFRAFGLDPRAALDAGAGVLVTADPGAVRYARVLPGYDTTPLSWSRTYVLVTGRTRGAVEATNVALEDVLPGGRDDMRAALPLRWLEHTCADAAFPPVTHTPAAASGRVLYPAGDAVAREVAERLTALAWPAGRAPAWLAALLPADGVRSPPATIAADEAALLAALRAGDALMFVVPLPRTGVVSCNALAVPHDALLRELLRAGAWSVTPLLDARDRMIHRRDIGRVIVDGDGVLIFGGAR